VRNGSRAVRAKVERYQPSRIYSRLSELEDKIEASRQDLSDELGDIKTEIREFRT